MTAATEAAPRTSGLAGLTSRCIVVLDLPDGPSLRRANVLTQGPGRALLALPAGSVEPDVLRVEATWVGEDGVAKLDARATVTRLRSRDLLSLDLRHGPVPRRRRKQLRGPVVVPVALTGLGERASAPAAHAGRTQDLSVGGLSVAVDEVLLAGPATALLELPDGPLAVSGRIVHSVPGMCRMAFSPLDRATQEQVVALCFRSAWDALTG